MYVQRKTFSNKARYDKLEDATNEYKIMTSAMKQYKIVTSAIKQYKIITSAMKQMWPQPVLRAGLNRVSGCEESCV